METNQFTSSILVDMQLGNETFYTNSIRLIESKPSVKLLIQTKNNKN